jgi:hypothetical protein
MRLEHRVRTSATPAQVWALLGNPGSWPLLDLTLRDVRGGGSRVVVGQRLMALIRLSAIGIPIDVLEAVPDERLVLLVHTAPGLHEQLSFDLTPSLRRGTDIRMSLVVDGPLAPAALVPRWLASCLATRVLAARTERQARMDRRSAA